MKKSVLASAIVLALGVSAANAGEIIQINPDAGGADPVLSVGSLDWSIGNAISIGVGSPELLQAAFDTQTPFQTYAHAALAGFVDGSGNPIGGIQLNGPTAATNYEWTYVTGFQEIVTSINGVAPNGTTTFQTKMAEGDNFFKIYFDASPDANNLTGSGFNDGVLILSGFIDEFVFETGEGASSFNTTGGFTIDPTTGLPVFEDFDQFNTNNYPVIDTVAGNGSSNLAVSVDFYDPDYFALPLTTLLVSLSFDTQQNLPYDQQNPSACFTDGTGAVVDGAGGQGTNCVNTVGAVNGLSGPNVMFMTDANTGFSTTVPEPASLALLGAGLLGFGLARLRKNQA